MFQGCVIRSNKYRTQLRHYALHRYTFVCTPGSILEWIFIARVIVSHSKLPICSSGLLYPESEPGLDKPAAMLLQRLHSGLRRHGELDLA